MGARVQYYLLAGLVSVVFLLTLGVTLLAVALWRTGQVRKALVEAGVRIAQLEAEVAHLNRVGVRTTAPAPVSAPAPVPMPAPVPAPAAARVREPAMAEAAASAAPVSAAPTFAPEPPRWSPPVTPPIPEAVARAPQVPDFEPASPASNRPPPLPQPAGPADWGWAAPAGFLAGVALLIGSGAGWMSAPLAAMAACGVAAAITLLGIALKPPTQGSLWRYAPVLGCVLMAAGVVALDRADVINPGAAYIALAALTVAAAAGSAIGAVELLVFALAAGAVAPVFTSLGADGVLVRHAHMVALSAAGLAAALSRRRTILAWASVVGGLAWGLYALASSAGDMRGALLAAGELAVLGALGLALAFDDAADGAPWRTYVPWVAARSPSLALAHALVLGAAAILVAAAFLAAGPEQAIAGGVGLAAIGVLAATLAIVRPGLSLLAIAGVGAGALGLLAWPEPQAAALGLSGVWAALALSLLALAAGWRTAQSPGLHSEAAALSGPLALAPLAAAALQAARVELWLLGAAAVTIAALAFFGAERLRKAGLAARPASWATVAAMGAAAALGVDLLVPAIWATLVLAALVPVCVYLERRLQRRTLSSVAMVLVGVVLYRIASPLELARLPIGETTLLNALLPLYATAVFCLWFAARLLEEAPWRHALRLSHWVYAAAILAGAIGVSALARHAFGGGDLFGPYASLAELGAHTLIWTATAAGLMWLGGARPGEAWFQPAYFSAEIAALSVAGVHAVISGLALANPWWGLLPVAAPTGPILFNPLFIGYAAPAAGFVGYGLLRLRRGSVERGLAGLGLGAAMGFTYVLLEVRRLFAGTDMAGTTLGGPEMALYTGALVAVAATLLWLGMERRVPYLRSASLAVAILALVKVALFDIAHLAGGWRGLALVAILALGGALVWFYQRVVFAGAGSAPRTAADPNLTPRR
jgi:hypothetical protein